MRFHLLFLSFLLCATLPGCLSEAAASTCAFDGETTWYLHEHGFMDTLPPGGRTVGNGFEEAFLSNDMDEWRSLRFDRTARIVGNVTLDLWVENDGVAPVVLGGDTGEGYHLFDQFGTDAGFVPSYAVEYAAVAPGGTMYQYEQVFEMPPGGVLVEAGDRIRLLLTSLIVDGDGPGHTVLTGGDTPSAITFTATCEATPSWRHVSTTTTAVALPLHQGLLTGAVPAEEGLNSATVPFVLDARTERLQVRIAETGAAVVKNDIDLTIMDASGDAVWSVGSPYTNEKGTLWAANLEAMMPPGDYAVRVDSYSGHAYEGVLEILQWRQA